MYVVSYEYLSLSNELYSSAIPLLDEFNVIQVNILLEIIQLST